jgi:N-acetylglutamate synthase-like GNAT family acetyltransferase
MYKIDTNNLPSHWQRKDLSMTIIYRPAQANDATAIKVLIRAVGINPLGLKWRRFVVAIGADGKLVGCGQIKPHRDGSYELASIAVQKAWRRQGVAAAIIQQLLAGQQPPVWLICMNKLVPFYEQFDFVEVENGRSMPSYFRRARRLFTLFQRFSSLPGYLAVMTWPTNSQTLSHRQLPSN